MLLSVIVVSTVIGFVIGAGAIGVTAQRMGRQRSQPVWRQEAAAAFIEENLAYEVAAELQPDHLRDLLRRHINQLQYGDSPTAANPTAASPTAASPNADSSIADSPTAASPTTASLTAASSAEPVTLTTHDDAIAALYAQARENGLEITRPVVAEVVKVHLTYLQSIGALVQSPQSRHP